MRKTPLTFKLPVPFSKSKLSSFPLSPRNETEPFANSTINTYENIKFEEDKSVQMELSLDLLLPGGIRADCEEELICETFWKIPDNFYFDSWHTHIIRSCPLDVCSVSIYGDIFRNGIVNGNVVNELTPTLF